MSRICVKNLPKYATEETIRSYFGTIGEITDVKVARTKDGRSRMFAFVGFRGEGDSEQAIKRHNKSFMDTSRLAVESAREIGDDHAMKAATSRHTKNKLAGAAAALAEESAASGRKREAAKPAVELIKSSIKDQEKLQEYLGLKKKSSAGGVWANDDTLGRAGVTSGKERRPAPTATEADVADKGAGDDDDGASTDSEEYGDVGGAPAVAKPLSDLDFMRQKVNKHLDEEVGGASAATTTSASASGGGKGSDRGTRTGDGHTRDSSAGEDTLSAPAPVPVSTSATVDASAEVDVGETGRLFVRNLPYACTEEDLKSHFSRWGKLADLKLPRDSAGKLKGFCYVLYMIPEKAVTALAEADGKIFQGRILHVLPSRPEPVTEAAAAAAAGAGEAGGAKNYKAKKEEKRKAGAASDFEIQAVWNTLFIRTDTAIAAVAEKMGVSKGDIMDRESKSLAVKVAVAETQVISETREFLKEEGIQLDKLEQALAQGPSSLAKRSETCIIVKNLPLTVDVGRVREMFGRFGSLVRCVLPPSRAIAVVEFADSRIAKKAFMALAYSRLDRMPLYLEWAPEALFTGPTPPPLAPIDTLTSHDTTSTSATQAGAGEGKRKRDESGAGGGGAEVEMKEAHTLYVKNVSFESTEEGLKEMFGAIGPLRSVRIPKKRNPKYRAGTPGQQWLSLGYGFVEYVNKEDALKALKSLQGKMLDEHALQLKLSKEGREEAPPDPKRAKVEETPEDAKATKLVVRNLAFEATRKDLADLFATYGTIKTVRLPKKFNGTHRGFAFVEFLTHAEAVAAMSALAATHLYGRHLVMEWAAAENDTTAGVGK